MIIRRPEAASQSFKKGQLLILNSSGQVAIFVASGSNHDTDADSLYGIALEDASGTTNANVKVRVFMPGDMLRLPVFHSTPGSAVTAETLVGETYVLRNVSGVPFINIETSTKASGRIVGIDDTYDIGESYGFVFVEPFDRVVA